MWRSSAVIGGSNEKNNIVKSVQIYLLWLFCLLFPLSPVSAGDPLTLRIALYEPVPDQERFRKAIRDEWSARHPDIPLEFADWSCYGHDPTDDLDVFVYDAMYFDEYLDQGWLLPLTDDEIENREDLIPFALEACTAGGTVYSIPEFLCADFLFTRRDDAAMPEVDTIPELFEVLGTVGTEDVPFQENDGLLVNLSTKSFLFTWYFQALADAEQADAADILPVDPDQLSREAYDSLAMIRKMAGLAQMTWKPENGDEYARGESFAHGYGRAFIGPSENMGLMGDEAENMDLRLFSMTDDSNISYFYADQAAVNANIRPDKRALAVELLNVITGTKVMVSACSPAASGENYQYLLPARISAYDELGKMDPVYEELRGLTADPEARIYAISYEDLKSLSENELLMSLLK